MALVNLSRDSCSKPSLVMSRRRFSLSSNRITIFSPCRVGRTDMRKSSCFFFPSFIILIIDRKSTRLNSSHADIYPLSLHGALPIFLIQQSHYDLFPVQSGKNRYAEIELFFLPVLHHLDHRSEEHTSELQSRRYLPSFPTRRSSDLPYPAIALRSFPRAEWEEPICGNRAVFSSRPSSS